MKRALSLFLTSIFIIIPILSPSRADSADCSDTSKIFSSTYKVEFSFDVEGNTRISQKVSLKNLIQGCFASEYSLKINTPNIKEVSGKDSLGQLTTRVKKDKNSSTISAKLNDEVIGKNKSVAFELNYKIEGLAKKNGLVWDLIVPTIVTREKVNSYSLMVVVPKTYGKIFLVQPNPENVTYGKKQTTLTFDKLTRSGKSIFASFGDQQQISFKMTVPLENKNFLGKDFSIYLPPDTQKQQILFTKLDPKPKKIINDNHGNLFAKYEVGGREYREVKIEGIAQIIGGKQSFSYFNVVSAEKLKMYALGGKFVNVDDPLIQEKAKELKTPEAIYEFVVNYLEFDRKDYEVGYSSSRKSATSMLRNGGETTNLGFVDLFTSLTKAVEFPTRQVYGFALSGDDSFKPQFIGSPLNTGKLHVWAQVYDREKKTWINYDPTWGNTVGVDYINEDLADRFVLFYSNSGDDIEVIKNSTISPENIKINPVLKKVNFKPNIDVKITSNQAFAGFPAEVVVTIENKSGLTLSNSQLVLNTRRIDLIGSGSVKIPQIFPFETKKYKFKLRAADLFKSKQGNTKVTLKSKSGSTEISETKEKEILVQAFFSFGVQQSLLVIVVLLIIFGSLAPRVLKYLKK